LRLWRPDIRNCRIGKGLNGFGSNAGMATPAAPADAIDDLGWVKCSAEVR